MFLEFSDLRCMVSCSVPGPTYLCPAGDQVVLSPASLCIMYISMPIIIHAFPFYHSTFLAFYLYA